jgi:predicted nucleotidyltransferase
MTDDEIRKKILEKAIQPAEYEIDGERVKNRSMTDLLALEAHLKKKKASKNPFAAMKIARISTQGPER